MQTTQGSPCARAPWKPPNSWVGWCSHLRGSWSMEAQGLIPANEPTMRQTSLTSSLGLSHRLWQPAEATSPCTKLVDLLQREERLSFHAVLPHGSTLKCISELLLRCATQTPLSVTPNGITLVASDATSGRLIHSARSGAWTRLTYIHILLCAHTHTKRKTSQTCFPSYYIAMLLKCLGGGSECSVLLSEISRTMCMYEADRPSRFLFSCSDLSASFF